MAYNLKKDRSCLVRPSLLLISCFISLLMVSYINSTRSDVYTSTAMNYQEINSVPTANTEIMLAKAELLSKQEVRFTFNTESVNMYTDVMTTKKLYIKVLDGDGNELATSEIKKAVQEVDVKLSDDFMLNVEANEEHEYYDDFTINYYYTDTEETLNYAEPFASSILKYQDLYVYSDLSDFDEKNKSEEEIISEVEYIQKYYLNNNFVNQLLVNEGIEINKILKDGYAEQHQEYKTIAKEIKDKYATYYQLLIQKGISEKEIKSIINSSDDLDIKLANLKQLSSKADETLEQKLSGYKKELNTNYGYSVDRINTLCDGKSSLEQAEILENEINRFKNDEVSDKEIDNEVKTLKKNDISEKKINAITSNKSLTNSEKLTKLKALNK